MSSDTSDKVDHNDSSSDIEYEVIETDSVNDAPIALVSVAMQSTPTLAAMALAITVQEWELLGHGNDHNVALSSDLTITVERLVALFVIRLVALVSDRNQQLEHPDPSIPIYSDLSTTTICRSALVRKKPWAGPISTALIQQVRDYVRRILEQYNGVYYHNFEHAYHVTISCNKLIDMMLHEQSIDLDSQNDNHQHVRFRRKTYGFKTDPLMQMALFYSAFIHDVEHKGVPNRQLVLESDELAILYNDQSVAEQRSLAVAFSELMKEEFSHLRQVMFCSPEEYRRFRQGVINLVLTTDIASPERTQLVKSKWKEAFGETPETLERKARIEMSRRSIFIAQAPIADTTDGKSTPSSHPNNFQLTKESSMPTSILGAHRRLRRRGSGGQNSMTSSASIAFSDMTTDTSLRLKTGFSESLTNIESDEETTSATPESTDNLEELNDPVDIDDKIIAKGTTLLASPIADIVTQAAVIRGLQQFKSKKYTPVGTLSRSLQPLKAIHGLGVSSPQIIDENDDVLPLPEMKRWVSDTFVATGFHDGTTSRSLGFLSKAYDNESTSSAMSCPVASAERMGALNRRNSSPMLDLKKHSVRLGIRRSLDLTGEQIEHYTASTRSVTPSTRSSSSGTTPSAQEIDLDPDESDPFKMAVVMEHIMRAADISANMQSFEHMEKWSHRLFYELKASFDDGRGEDPQNGWYDNQITFLDSYILPLARRMDDTGVFGHAVGKMFAKFVLENRERWVNDGIASTSHVIQEWNIMSTNQGGHRQR